MNGARSVDPDKLSTVMFLFGMSSSNSAVDPLHLSFHLDFIDGLVEFTDQNNADATELLLENIYAKFLKATGN